MRTLILVLSTCAIFVVFPFEAEAQATCADGTYSSSSGSGTCSHHGGVASYGSRGASTTSGAEILAIGGDLLTFMNAFLLIPSFATDNSFWGNLTIISTVISEGASLVSWVIEPTQLNTGNLIGDSIANGIVLVAAIGALIRIAVSPHEPAGPVDYRLGLNNFTVFF